MDLNLPILDRLAGSRSILLAGMGGGFDVFCGLPIYFALRRRGHQVHLANLTFADLPATARLAPGLAGMTADAPPPVPVALLATLQAAAQAGAPIELDDGAIYAPEHYLVEWFRQQRGEDVTVWCFEKTGLTPLTAAYRALVAHLAVDAVVLVDGGVDSLARGDEPAAGTFVEDMLSLAAVGALAEVPVRLVACVGLGAEQDIAYAHILENIAGLAAAGHFLGACALTPQMPDYMAYEAAVLYVQGQPLQSASVINSSVISAVRGHFGDYHLTRRTRNSQLWISPLMTLYWFFDLPGLAANNRLIGQLPPSTTFHEALQAILRRYHATPSRPHYPVRLP